LITGIDHVQVAAPPGCEAEARRFYGELLGLEEVAKPAGVADTGGAWFKCGNQGLHVGVQPDFTPSAKGHPGLAVSGEEELMKLAQRLVAGGAPIEWDERLEGVMRFFTRDPWGNRIELCVPRRGSPS
jgi:catechol 2,3-dioxygenase-like lactoylglutathione lyase family enzyme